MQPSREAYEAEDRCFRVAVARRLVLPHPAAANPTDVVRTCPNKSATGQICTKPVDVQQNHCYGCRYGGGVDRRHAAEATYLADVIHSHSGTKVYIEQAVPALTRVMNGQREHARMDLVFKPQRFHHVPGCGHCGSFFQQPCPRCCSQHQPRSHGQES